MTERRLTVQKAAKAGKEEEPQLTHQQISELLETEGARAFVEAAEERGHVEPTELEAFALEHDLDDADVGAARASELLFDLAVGGRLRRELVEGCVEQALGILVATLAAAEEAEVCDHLSLELFVSQLPKEDERLLEVLNCDRDAAGGVDESEGEVVERQRLGAPVAQLTHDRQRGAMLLDSPFVLAFDAEAAHRAR